MKILFLNPSGQLGGGELSLLDLLASLRNACPRWALALIASSDGPLLERANALGIETAVAPFPADLARLGDASVSHKGKFFMMAKLAASTPSVLRYRAALARAIRKFAPDVLHTNGFKMHVLGALAVNGTPIVWHVRDFVSNRPIMARIMRRTAKRNVTALANSKAVANDLRDLLPVYVKIHPIHDAIDLNSFCPTGPKLDLDAASGLSPAASGVIRVGLVATFAFWKGHEVFLRAIAISRKQANLRAYIVGGEIYQTSGSQVSLQQLRALAAELGIEDCVGFTGQVCDSAAAMRSLDIVVHASTRPEPFGRVIVEAMACGRPVIAAAHGGSAELVTPNVDALTHAPGNSQSLADAITRLATNRELRSELAKAGEENARERFDLSRLAGEIIPVYEEQVN